MYHKLGYHLLVVCIVMSKMCPCIHVAVFVILVQESAVHHLAITSNQIDIYHMWYRVNSNSCLVKTSVCRLNYVKTIVCRVNYVKTNVCMVNYVMTNLCRVNYVMTNVCSHSSPYTH